MEFGKVDTSLLNQIDLSLPPDDPRTWVQLKKTADKSALPHIYVGCPVWGVKEWVGKVYPTGTPAKEYLPHYARQFNTIELNTTHYRVPDEETIKRWRESVPSEFKFCPKFPQEISHRRPLSSHREMTRQFITAVMGLEENLGLSFLQLAPSFGPHDVADLREFLKQIPSDFPLAIEFRHPGFFREHLLATPLYELLEKTGTGVVITDVAGRRDVLHTSLTSSRAIVRFISNDHPPSDDARLSEWIARIHTWITLGIEELHFFIHSPDNTTAPDLINRFISRLNLECGLHLHKWVLQEQQTQLGLF